MTQRSYNKLVNIERKILKLVNRKIDILDVDIGYVFDSSYCKIHTIKVYSSNNISSTPLLLIHGFGCGLGIFVMNLESLSENRDIYAIDIPGFGLSTRINFDKNAKICEDQMSQLLELWRDKMNITHMDILGHSLGGFIASSYTLKYPQYIKNLILEDPWGFPVYNERSDMIKIILLEYLFEHVNIFYPIRIIGPIGLLLMRNIINDYHYYLRDYFPKNPNILSDYIYYCCSIKKATGEDFFRNISCTFGWTKHPMMLRLYELNNDINIIIIYASDSFISKNPGTFIKEKRKVDIIVVANSGHIIHAEYPTIFNKIINNTLC